MGKERNRKMTKFIKKKRKRKMKSGEEKPGQTAPGSWNKCNQCEKKIAKITIDVDCLIGSRAAG